MALVYKNTLRGHVVEVPEPADIIAAAEVEAERLFRKGTKRDRLDAELVTDKARAQAQHQRQTLAKMDESRRWERYTAPLVAVPVVQEPTPALDPTPAEVTAKAVRTVAKPVKETEA